MTGAVQMQVNAPPTRIFAEPVGDQPALPYDPFPVPPYRALDGTDWRLWRGDADAAHGYFHGYQTFAYPFFGLRRGDYPWMTLQPIEVESQWPHLQAARGHTVIGGLGMALMAYAVSEKPDVTKVTVVERDPEVADLAPRFAYFDSWPHRDKVQIVVQDMLTYRSPDPVDFLYVDIWRGYREDPKLAAMQAIHANNPAARVGYWGQEVEAVDWAVRQGCAVEDFDASAFQAFCDASGLPLIGMERDVYPQLCIRAATNPNLRGAPGAPSPPPLD